MMQSLGSWIDVEELEFLATTLIESERRRMSIARDSSRPPLSAGIADEGGAGPAIGGGANMPGGVPPHEHDAPAVAGELVPDQTAGADDLATRFGPVDKGLVERVRMKLQALAIEIPDAVAMPGAAESKGMAVPSATPHADFEVGEGTLLHRLEQFTRWACRLTGSMPVVMDYQGDLLVSGSGIEPWFDAVPMAVRALDQIAGLLNAEPESRCSRMAWLAPDDGAGLVVVGAELHGQPVWVGWIETKPLDRQTLEQVRAALQRAVTGSDGDRD